ncbi:hypothetical protein F53441_9430 [Fusarium austroafricanum]|uniref:G domain-containing protein n=1 Tax=Fusarium austroafricanum TaxID=2364996 RepID=A0A8H4KBR3_9HYPO|nr:hypothetical protein F53441_9430 [Fusarium austroafricanum]
MTPKVINLPAQATSDLHVDLAHESEVETTGKLPIPIVQHDGSSEPYHDPELVYNKDHISSDPSDERSNRVDDSVPRHWTWGYDKLKKLLSEAKGAASNEVVKFVTKHLAGTKLIFVVSKTRTGKTSILSELTGLESLQPGTTLKTGIIDDEQYLFIDTAGFGDPGQDDIETFRDSVSSLISFGPFVQVVGVLFVIGNPGTRLDQQDAKTLRWLQCFCGPDFYRNITFVTSFWDSYNERSFKQAYARMDSLREDANFAHLLDPSSSERRYHGAYLYHHGVTGGNLMPESYPGLDIEENRAERQEELKNLIRRRYAELKYKPVKLQFMKEVENKVDFVDTEAAKVLRAPAVGTTVSIVKGKCVVEAVAGSSEAPPFQFEPRPKVPQTSWTQTILEWWEIAVRAAKIYKDARMAEAAKEVSGIKRLWQGVSTWWKG